MYVCAREGEEIFNPFPLTDFRFHRVYTSDNFKIF